MTVSVREASEYFRGLLLLVRKDRQVTAAESGLLKRVGGCLGFEPAFCENAILEILDNEFVLDAPPHFSSKELAAKFIRDGLTIAFSDARGDTAEIEWLRLTANVNGLDPDWLAQEQIHAARRTTPPARLEVETLTVLPR